jgi:serine/threonine protein kinase
MDEDENLSSTQSFRESPGAASVSYSRLHPTKIGRYTIVKRIGEGGFGQVLLAYDDDLDRPVAIKIPRPDRVSPAHDVDAFLNEAQILANLDHPHIVPVHDVGRTEEGQVFVVSKFIKGSDLRARTDQARPSFHDSAELIATIAEALHYAHTRGLVHRDIKPANIVIDDSGRAFVADFGLALTDEDFGRGGGMAGTPSYMSPEQARGEGHRVGGRSDIFSLGVVFYELLTGRRPFIAKAADDDEALTELLDLIATTEARPPRQIDDTIPKELERICQKALSKRASERYSTAKDMAEDLRLFLQTADSALSPAAPPAHSPRRPARRRKRHGFHQHQYNPTRTRRQFESSPKGFDPSTNTMPTASWHSFPDLGTGMDCPRASGSGRRGSRPPTATRRFAWVWSMGPPAAASRRS